jgi:hypothetical protein
MLGADLAIKEKEISKLNDVVALVTVDSAAQSAVGKWDNRLCCTVQVVRQPLSTLMCNINKPDLRKC